MLFCVSFIPHHPAGRRGSWVMVLGVKKVRITNTNGFIFFVSTMTTIFLLITLVY